MSTVHTYPVHDLIEHDTDGGDCPCGPTTEPVERDDGSFGWHVIHNSLDGRELREAPLTGLREGLDHLIITEEGFQWSCMK